MTPLYIEYTLSKYSSNFLRFIKRLLPFHNTKLQFLSSDNFRNLFIPIPEYADASSNVRFDFSQMGISLCIYFTSLPHYHNDKPLLIRFFVYPSSYAKSSAYCSVNTSDIFISLLCNSLLLL